MRWMISLPQTDRGIASDRSEIADWSGTSMVLCPSDSLTFPLAFSLSFWSPWPKAGSPAYSSLTMAPSAPCATSLGAPVQTLVKAGCSHHREPASGVELLLWMQGPPLPLTRQDAAKWKPWGKKILKICWNQLCTMDGYKLFRSLIEIFGDVISWQICFWQTYVLENWLLEKWVGSDHWISREKIWKIWGEVVKNGDHGLRWSSLEFWHFHLITMWLW